VAKCDVYKNNLLTLNYCILYKSDVHLHQNMMDNMHVTIEHYTRYRTRQECVKYIIIITIWWTWGNSNMAVLLKKLLKARDMVVLDTTIPISYGNLFNLPLWCLYCGGLNLNVHLYLPNKVDFIMFIRCWLAKESLNDWSPYELIPDEN
jgi:hypothetical protein